MTSKWMRSTLAVLGICTCSLNSVSLEAAPNGLTRKDKYNQLTQRFAQLPQELQEAHEVFRRAYTSNDNELLSKIHNSAYQYIVSFPKANQIQFEDQSIWRVYPVRGADIRKWTNTDKIFIKPTAYWFTAGQYVLHNFTRCEVAEATLEVKPLKKGFHTRTITRLDLNNRLVQIDNGNEGIVWEIPQSEVQKLYQWQIGDQILVGVNNYWRGASNPQILINVDRADQLFCEANFFSYAPRQPCN